MRSPVGLFRTGKGPTTVVFAPDGGTAYVLNQLDYTIGEYALETMFTPSRSHATDQDAAELQPPSGGENVAPPRELFPVRQASFGFAPRPASVRRGHRLFTFANNPSISDAWHTRLRGLPHRAR